MSREYINELIAKYTVGQITTEQYRKLREEINHRSDEELLSMLQQEWEKSLLLKDDLVTSDLNELLSSIRKQTAPLEQVASPRRKIVHRRHLLLYWSASAAVAAILLFLFMTVDWRMKDDRLEEIAFTLKEVSDETEEIQLIFSDDKTVTVDKGAIVAYNTNGVVSINEQQVDNGQVNEDKSDGYNRLIVPKGKYTRLVLSDGTQMYVNAGTKVVYPRVFSKKSREIYVEGEVFLNVTPDKRVPFIVQTSGFDVQVLGTAFDINAYSDTSDDAEVVLLHGKVNIKSKSGKELILTPDNKATILSNGLIRKSHVNAEEYILWTKGILSLNNEPLRVILAKLSRYYGVSIHCCEEISQVIMSGKIDLECGIHEALERLSSTGGFTSVKQNNIYILKPLEEIVQ